MRVFLKIPGLKVKNQLLIINPQGEGMGKTNIYLFSANG
jgi:hypothetical protein